jgi:hypothetical protein
MRLLLSALLAGAALTMVVAPAEARSARQSDCVPYNGPFGFYGNIWCQPPNEASYMRNLGSSWPQKTPRKLRNPKPSSNYEW